MSRRENAKELLKACLTEYVNRITTKSRGSFYVCPLCGSGTGRHSTGAFSIASNEVTWKCFACDQSGDIFTLYGLVNNERDFRKQLDGLAEEFGIILDDEPKTPTQSHENGANFDFSGKVVKVPAEDTHAEKQQNNADEEYTNFKEFFDEAAKHIEETDYHRGITLETLHRFDVGYISEWRHPKAPASVPTSPRLIIPTSTYSYLARDTREEIPEQAKPYSKSKVGSVHLFNTAALYQIQPAIIVEGELDALSVLDVGGQALALGSVSNVDLLLKAIDNIPKRSVPPIVIALDNDEAGRKAAKTLADGLDRRILTHIQADICGGYKDANEALQADRDSLWQAVQQATERAKNKHRERIFTGLKELDTYLYKVAGGVYKPTSTGVPWLDNLIGGGFRRQTLVCVGGAPGLGKTALMQEIAEHTAAAGQPAIYINLEMSKEQLYARTLARLSHELGDHSLSVNGYLDGSTWTQRQRETVYNAAQLYAKRIGDRLTYNPDGITADLESVLQYIDHAGEKSEQQPVIFLDYLQLLRSEGDDAAATVKKAVAELKSYAIERNTTVVCAVAHNRESNKSGTVTLSSARDSSAIEYSADIYIGLAASMDGEDSGRMIKVVKSRFSAAGKEIELTFNGNNMTFCPRREETKIYKRF